MARIESLSVRGLKSDDREIALAPLVLVLGPVGAGKSELLNALSFGALGYVPSIGKAEAATAKLMRNGSLEVRLVLDDGREITRGLYREGQKLRGEAFGSWLPPKTRATEASDRIVSLFGASEIEAAEHLDLRTLLSASPAERARRVEKLLDASGLEPDTLSRRGAALVILRLADLALDRMPADVGQAEMAASGALITIPDTLRTTADVVANELAGLLLQGLSGAQERANANKRDAAASASGKVKARAELEDRLAALGRPTRDLAELQAAHDAAASMRDMSKRDLEHARETAKLKSAAETNLPALEQALEESRRAHGAALEALPRAQLARAEAKGITDPLAIAAPAMVPVDPSAVDAVRVLEQEAEKMAAEARGLIFPEPLSVVAEQAAVAEAERTLKLAEKSPWREVERIADDLENVTTTDADAEARLMGEIDRLRSLAAEHGGSIEALAPSLDAKRVTLKEAVARVDARKAERDALDVRKSGLERDAADRRAAAKGLREQAEAVAQAANADARAAYTDAFAKRAAAVELNRVRRDRLQSEAQAIEAGAQEAQRAVDKALSDVAEVRARVAGIASINIDVAKTEADVAAAETLLGELAVQIDAGRKREAVRREMTALIAEIDRATAEQKAWAAAEWACQKLREEDLAARAKGLEARMRTFLEAAGRTEQPFLRAHKSGAAFGWRRGEQEIEVEALSGGETILFCTALAAAIVALRAPELRVLLVEAAELGIEAAPSLLSGLEAVAPDLGNVVVATCLPVKPSPAWRVLDLAAVPAGAVA